MKKETSPKKGRKVQVQEMKKKKEKETRWGKKKAKDR